MRVGPISSAHLREIERAAVEAARAAGLLMRKNARVPKKINSSSQHDIKLELDVRCQKLIEGILLRSWPEVAILGEEESVGQPQKSARWVVDPIDGTVNFAYGIPHACVSIAFQAPAPEAPQGYRTEVGVVYDPFADELWTARRGGLARLNGRPIYVSRRSRLVEAIASIGFAKWSSTVDSMLPTFNGLIHRVRKIRIMGSAALSLVYVATGRFDLYVEKGLRLWDIAAGGLIVEAAGGEFWNRPLELPYSYQIIASNGLLRRKLPRGPGVRSAPSRGKRVARSKQPGLKTLR